MCKVLVVLKSYYYRWFTGKISQIYFENKQLTQVIKQVFQKNKNTYGKPRIAANLKRQGYVVYRTRVDRIIRKEGLRSNTKRRFKITTASNHGY